MLEVPGVLQVQVPGVLQVLVWGGTFRPSSTTGTSSTLSTDE